MHANCSRDLLDCATTSGCCRRNTRRKPGGWLEISPRPSPILRSSILLIASCKPERRLPTQAKKEPPRGQRAGLDWRREDEPKPCRSRGASGCRATSTTCVSVSDHAYGQPALVTGANSGIGRAVALGLAASGADVIVNYVANPAAAEDVAHAIETDGRRALAIKADVSNEDQVRAMLAQAVAHF